MANKKELLVYLISFLVTAGLIYFSLNFLASSWSGSNDFDQVSASNAAADMPENPEEDSNSHALLGVWTASSLSSDDAFSIFYRHEYGDVTVHQNGTLVFQLYYDDGTLGSVYIFDWLYIDDEIIRLVDLKQNEDRGSLRLTDDDSSRLFLIFGDRYQVNLEKVSQ